MYFLPISIIIQVKLVEILSPTPPPSPHVLMDFHLNLTITYLQWINWQTDKKKLRKKEKKVWEGIKNRERERWREKMREMKEWRRNKTKFPLIHFSCLQVSFLFLMFRGINLHNSLSLSNVYRARLFKVIIIFTTESLYPPPPPQK